MKPLVLPFVLLATLSVALTSANAAIRVVDELGQPVAQFEVMLHTVNDGYQSWKKCTNGQVSANISPSFVTRSPAVDVLVRADGFASAIHTYQDDERKKLLSGEAPIVLTKGVEVRLRLNMPKDVKLPDGLLPQLYFPEYAFRVQMMWQPQNLRDGRVPDFNMLNLRPAENGEFVFRLPKEKREFQVAIHQPGWLRFFEVGPYTIDDFRDGVLTIDVPRAERIAAQFNFGQADRASLPFDRVGYDVMWNIPGRKGSVLTVASGQQSLAELEFAVEDVAPGNYVVTLRTSSSSQSQETPRAAGINPANFIDQKRLEVKSNEGGQAKFSFVPFDPDAFRGNRNAELKILNFDGTPVAGKKGYVGYFDGNYGVLTVFEGEVPSDGVVRLAKVTDRVSELRDTSYQIGVGSQVLGTFRIAASDELQKLEYRIPPQAGDRAPDLALIDARTGETVRLSDYRGRVVFLEFWATWCGPCQPPMAKLNKEIGEHGDAWRELAVVPVSVDYTRDLVGPHVDSCGWTKMRHFWSGGATGESFFSSPAAAAFGVNGVPTAILIDRAGMIAWCGQPEAINLEERMKEFSSDKGKE